VAGRGSVGEQGEELFAAVAGRWEVCAEHEGEAGRGGAELLHGGGVLSAVDGADPGTVDGGPEALCVVDVGECGFGDVVGLGEVGVGQWRTEAVGGEARPGAGVDQGRGGGVVVERVGRRAEFGRRRRGTARG
jgi:hypothetical protein